MSDFCKKHKVQKYYADCSRCDGDGYTQSDLDDLDDPLSFSDGSCYACKGSGRANYKTCEECELEAREEMEEL